MIKFQVKSFTEGNMNGNPYWKVFAEEVTTAVYKQSINASITKQQFDELEVGDIISDPEFRYTAQLKNGGYGDYYVQKLKLVSYKLEKTVLETPFTTASTDITGDQATDVAVLSD